MPALTTTRSLAARGARLCLLTVVLASCGSVFHHMSAEDRQIAATYLENAAQYYDTAHYDRALQQWERALELNPNEDKARLGAAMALYQLGQEESARGVERLSIAEARLAELRDGGLGDLSWKAEIGYALTQERWVELCDRKIRKLTAPGATLTPADTATLATAREQFTLRLTAAERAFQSVLANRLTEPNFQMTCWLGLARAAAYRSDWDGALFWAHKYETKIVESKEFWQKQGKEYSTRLFGAELQEAELRDVMANCLFKLGQPAEAEAELDKLIVVQPARADAYLQRGKLRFDRAAWDLAQSDLRRFLHLTNRPSDDDAVLKATKALVEAEERLDADEQR